MKRIIKDWEEQDAYTGWRKYLVWTSRPGAVKKVKKRTHHRERQEGKKEVRDQMKDIYDD